MSGTDQDYSPRRTADAADTVSLLDILATLARRRWLIVGITGLTGLVTFALLVLSVKLPPTSRLNLMPNRFTPEVTVLLQPSSQSGSLSSLLSQGGLGSVSGLVSGTGQGQGTAKLVQALLKTDTILDKVADEFEIVRRFEGTFAPRTSARGWLRSRLRFVVDASSGVATIGFEDVDRELATGIVNRLVLLAKDQFNDLTTSRATEKRAALEAQLQTATDEVARLEAALIAFQDRYGVYDIAQQAAATTQTVASLRAQIVSKEITLSAQLKYLPETDYRIVQLRNEIAETQKAIDSLTKGSVATASGAIPQKELQSLSAQYAAMQRDLTGQQTIVSTVRQQYEAARMEELSVSQVIQVIEMARVPEVKSGPSRSRIGVMAVLAAAVVSILLAFVAEYFSRARQDPAEAGKLQVIRDTLRPRRRARRG